MRKSTRSAVAVLFAGGVFLAACGSTEEVTTQDALGREEPVGARGGDPECPDASPADPTLGECSPGEDEDGAVPSQCRSSETMAHDAAFGGAQLEEAVTADTFVATLDAIEDAQGEPFQHRPSDMQAAMCVFVLQGTRPDPSRDAVTVVVLNPAFPPDLPGPGEGFFFTETRDGNDPPAWVRRLESADT